MFRSIIEASLKKAVKELSDYDVEVSIDVPEENFGDYSSNAPMQAFGKMPTDDPHIKLDTLAVRANNPRDYAEKLRELLQKDTNLMEVVEKIDIAGPGFLNFWLKKEALLESMINYKFPISNGGDKKKVVVEYSSPNIAKPFTIGHLRSTLIGDAIANLMQATGWTVYRDNHVGDWGTQFGKQIYAIKTWGNEEELEKSPNPVQELVKLYVKFHEEAEKDKTIEDEGRAWFKKLEDGDPEARRLWKKCIDWSMKEFDEYYELLGIKFTENNGLGYGESFAEDKMNLAVQELRDKNLLKKGEDGAELVFFDEKSGYPPLMILKKDGASLYSTRDLAIDKWRLSHYGKDVVIINEVGAEQSLYFQQLIALEVMLGWIDYGQKVHIKHGFFRFADRKMSTRKGNVIWLKDVLQEAIDRARILSTKSGSDDKDIDVLAKQVAVGALKWNELKRDPIKDIVFDWDEILNMEGNSGPYLQYTFARTQSVIRKGEKPSFDETRMLFNQEELSVLRILSRFNEVVEDAALKYAPNLLCNYLYELAQKFNSFYSKHRILEAEEGSKQFRLALTHAAGQVLQDGLHLLGIETPEKM